MNSNSQAKTLYDNKLGNLIIKTGSIIILSTIILVIGVFGITFGTIFLGSVGILLTLWGIFKRLNQIEQYKLVTNVIGRIALILFIIWLSSFLVIQGLIIYAISSSNEAVEVDYVLVLGAGLRGEEPSLTLSRRLDKSLEYLEMNPSVKAIVSGGQGPGETITEAEAMKRFLVKNGIEEQRIIKEDKSTNTKENIMFSKEILDRIENGEIREIVIISSEFHLLRAQFLAKRNGLISYGIPAKTPRIVVLNYFMREYFAVVKSFIFDF